MAPDVNAPWAADADIMDLTDTDLQASRMRNTKISDSSKELHRLVETLRQHEGLEEWSTTCDRALRVEIAYAIDNHLVTFDRDEYDVAYTIPPAGWLGSRVFSEVKLVPREDVEDTDRGIAFSTPPVVFEMAQQVLEEGDYETLTDLVQSGVERLLGRRSA